MHLQIEENGTSIKPLIQTPNLPNKIRQNVIKIFFKKDQVRFKTHRKILTFSFAIDLKQETRTIGNKIQTRQPCTSIPIPPDARRTNGTKERKQKIKKNQRGERF